MVAHLTRLLGPAHLELAEETVQEAMLRALQTWPYQGVPENAAAWLFRVAHNVAIDAVRRDRTLGEKTDAIVAELSHGDRGATPDHPDLEEQLRDDELRMIFMCCHPEISRDARVALEPEDRGRIQRARDRPRVSGRRCRHRAAAGARQAADPRRPA